MSSILNETFIVTPRVIEIYMCKRQILIDFIILTSNNDDDKILLSRGGRGKRVSHLRQLQVGKVKNLALEKHLHYDKS